MKVQLTLKERKLVKRIIKIQLEALKDMLNDDCGEDMTLWCIQEEINKQKLEALIKGNIREFFHVYMRPEYFLDLRPLHLSTFKHIMQTTIPKQRNTKRGLWRKIFINEDLNYYLNMESDLNSNLN